jgi:Fe2+ transport system protein FeoA
MRRRDLLAPIGAILLSPFSAAAQQTERIKRLAVLVSALPSDPEYPLLLDALRRRLEELGWKEGQNLRVEVRWGGGGPDAIYNNAVELVALAPDLIVAAGGAATGPAQRSGARLKAGRCPARRQRRSWDWTVERHPGSRANARCRGAFDQSARSSRAGTSRRGIWPLSVWWADNYLRRWPSAAPGPDRPAGGHA